MIKVCSLEIVLKCCMISASLNFQTSMQCLKNKLKNKRESTYFLAKVAMALYHCMVLLGNKIIQVCQDTLLNGKLRIIAFTAGRCHYGARSFEEILIDLGLFHDSKFVAKQFDFLIIFCNYISTATLSLPR